MLRVTRRGPEAVHFVPAALEPGAEVLLSLDWERRFDHMQQHSGPHRGPARRRRGTRRRVAVPGGQSVPRGGGSPSSGLGPAAPPLRVSWA